MDTGGSEEPYTPFNARSACHVLDAAFALVLHGLAELLLAGRVYSSGLLADRLYMDKCGSYRLLGGGLCMGRCGS